MDRWAVGRWPVGRWTGGPWASGPWAGGQRWAGGPVVAGGPVAGGWAGGRQTKNVYYGTGPCFQQRVQKTCKPEEVTGSTRIEWPRLS